MGKVAILGAGRWGCALGLVLSRKGNEVMLFDRNPSVVGALKEGKDPYWGIDFEKKPLATTHLEEALDFSQCILIALPVQVIRKVLEGKSIKGKVFISASKGLEVGTNRRVSEILKELFPDCKVLALSGPSFAEETAKGLPCAVVLAGEDVALLREVRELFSSELFRVYLSEDIVGVELGGGVKECDRHSLRYIRWAWLWRQRKGWSYHLLYSLYRQVYVWYVVRWKESLEPKVQDGLILPSVGKDLGNDLPQFRDHILLGLYHLA